MMANATLPRLESSLETHHVNSHCLPIFPFICLLHLVYFLWKVQCRKPSYTQSLHYPQNSVSTDGHFAGPGPHSFLLASSASVLSANTAPAMALEYHTRKERHHSRRDQMLLPPIRRHRLRLPRPHILDDLLAWLWQETLCPVVEAECPHVRPLLSGLQTIITITITIAAFTMSRCRSRWQFILIAV